MMNPVLTALLIPFLGTIGFALGFALMMVLDVVLG